VGLFDFLKPKDDVPYEKIYNELEVFTEASLAMPKLNNPFLLDNKDIHPMIFGYFMGVIDHLAKVYKLNDKEKRTVCTQYLLKNFANNNMDRAKELVKYCENIMQTDDANNYALRGKLAVKKWRAGGPMADYATMGLIRILND
jgi:hypothetical protein